MPDSIIELERNLRSDIIRIETELQRMGETKISVDQTRIQKLRESLFSLNSMREELLARTEVLYPSYFALKYASNTPTVSAIQKHLDERSGIIEYAVGEHELFIFLISHSRFELKVTPIARDLRLTISSLGEAVRKVDEEKFVRASALLYDYLVRPIRLSLQPLDRLIVIPDGILYSIPFETLVESIPIETQNTRNFSTLNYLVKRYDFTYSYSAAFYLNRALSGQTMSSKQMAFGGFAPVFRDTENEGGISSPLQQTSAGEKSRAIVVGRKRFEELRFSKPEVDSIAEEFRRRGFHAENYVYEAASEDNFKNNAMRFSTIHIATHGFIDEEEPSISMLLFARPSDSTAREDGLLYAGETYNLKLNADLITLSCCECGKGRLIRGEGTMAMTRGFFYSGARNVLYSLWKVYDKQASEFMIEFYRRALTGEKYASALRQAKLKMISKRSTAFPINWGGFVLVGE